jgi:hypothetical protein
MGQYSEVRSPFIRLEFSGVDRLQADTWASAPIRNLSGVQSKGELVNVWSWRRQKKSFDHAGSWPIVRTRPRGKVYGRALPIFIRNMDHHFVTLDVYADGAFDCWRFVDRHLLKEEIRTGWLEVAPPKGSTISVFNLGRAEVQSAEWEWRTSDIYPLAEHALCSLNPSMCDLLDLEGSATEPINGVQHYKLGLSDKKPFRATDDKVEHLGASLPMLLAQPDGEWQLVSWFIFADGASQLGTSGVLAPLDATIDEIRAGSMRTEAPDGAWIRLLGLGKFKARSGTRLNDIESRIAEARDELQKLRTGRGSIVTCREAFERHQAELSSETLEALRVAYFAVPAHLRCFCGDMDNRDWPIKAALGLDQRRW